MELDNLKALVTHEMPKKHSKKSNQPEFGVIFSTYFTKLDIYNPNYEINDQAKLLRSSSIQFLGSKN
jgi:hypothetical protein